MRTINKNTKVNTKINTRELKEKAKTYAIFALGAYIVGTKIIVHPIGIISRVVLILLSVAMGFVSMTETEVCDGVDMNALSYLSAIMVGFFLAA